MNILEQIKSKKYVIAGAFVLAIAVLGAAVFTTVKAYAVEGIGPCRLAVRLQRF